MKSIFKHIIQLQINIFPNIFKMAFLLCFKKSKKNDRERKSKINKLTDVKLVTIF